MPTGSSTVRHLSEDTSIGQLYTSLWDMQPAWLDQPASQAAAPPFILVDELMGGEQLLDFGMQLKESNLARSGSELHVRLVKE
jgi:hypothetical protein